MIFGAIAFAVLKWMGVISLNWLWIIGAAILAPIPLAKTIVFVVFQMMGLFAVPVSWWWIILPILLDLGSITDLIQ